MGRVFLLTLMVLAALLIFPVESLRRNAEFLRLLRFERSMANTGLTCTETTLDQPRFTVKYAQLVASLLNKRYDVVLKSVLDGELDGTRHDMITWKLVFDLFQDGEFTLVSQALDTLHMEEPLPDEKLLVLGDESKKRGELELAAAYWSVWVILDPSELRRYELLGSFYLGYLDDRENAIAVFEAGSRRVSVDWEASYLAGRVATVRNDWSQAAHYYRVAIEQGANGGLYYYRLALALQELGDFAGVVAVCEEATRISPGFYACYRLLGDVYASRVKGDAQSAIYWLERGLEHVTHDSYRSIFYERLGSIYLAGGDLQKAVTYFEQAIELDSKNAEALQGMSATLAFMDDVEGGLESKE